MEICRKVIMPAPDVLINNYNLNVSQIVLDKIMYSENNILVMNVLK